MPLNSHIDELRNINIADGFIDRIEYDVSTATVVIKLSRCFEASGQEVSLSIEFHRVAHLAAYSEPSFSADQSLVIALAAIPIPESVSSITAEFGPWIELNPDFGVAGSRALAVSDKRGSSSLRCFLFEAIGLNMLIVCHEIIIMTTGLDDHAHETGS